MMKLSDEFVDWFNANTEITTTNRGHFVKTTKKPNARQKVDLDTLMIAFGGHKNLKQEWEFTYIPTFHLTHAIRHEFNPLYRDNVAFLPTHIEKKMLAWVNVRSSDRVLMPHYGYGLQEERDWEITKLNNYTGKDDVVEGKYSGIFFRGILREGKDWEPLRAYGSLLSLGGICVAMICSNTAKAKDFTKYVDSNFSFYRHIEIPHHEMSSGTNRCNSCLIILKK